LEIIQEFLNGNWKKRKKPYDLNELFDVKHLKEVLKTC